jgi:hypothetical protein
MICFFCGCYCIKAKEHKKQINKIYYFLSFAATKRKENKEKSPLHINLLKLYAFYLTQPKPFGNKLKFFNLILSLPHFRVAYYAQRMIKIIQFLNANLYKADFKNNYTYVRIAFNRHQII